MDNKKTFKQSHPERELTKEETEEILNIQSDDVSATLIKKLFGAHFDSAKKKMIPPRFNQNDYFKLPTTRFNTVKEVYTTIGIYIFNIFIIQPHFSSVMKYVNKPITQKALEDIEDKLSSALYNDKITTDDMADYYNRIQWLGGDRSISIISPSLTPALLSEPKEIIKKKEELFKKYEKELNSPNKDPGIIGGKIEKELVSAAEEYLDDVDGSENFDSKAKANISNHYKNMNVLKGSIFDSYENKYCVNKSNYNTGIKKEEYYAFAGSAVLGSYMRAVNTGKGGYLGKETYQGLIDVKAGGKGTDCKTTKTLPVYLYPKNKYEYLNRYIVDKSKGLIELTEDNWNQYENSTVNMRSPMFCQMPEPCYCNICTGNEPYKLNLENFGLSVARISLWLMNNSMKFFHDSAIKLSAINPNDVFIFDD